MAGINNSKLVVNEAIKNNIRRLILVPINDQNCRNMQICSICCEQTTLICLSYVELRLEFCAIRQFCSFIIVHTTGIYSKYKAAGEGYRQIDTYMRQYVRNAEKIDRQKRIYEKYIKRVMDVILSFCILVILSPLYVVLCLAVIIDDLGSVFFTQKGVGRNKKFFNYIRFVQ